MIKSLKTKDGSLTLFSEKFQETYHSRHGALTESLHVFIENGLAYKAKSNQTVKVGEIGLGTGLNAMLSLQFAQRNQTKIDYVAMEAFPLSNSIKNELIADYHIFNPEIYAKILHQPEAQSIEPDPYFSFQWYEKKWPQANPFEDLDVIFYDAFAPDTQPELWDENAMNAAFSSLKPGGILVTYCAKGYVRRNLINAGFIVERLQGPPGKREMLRGTNGKSVERVN